MKTNKLPTNSHDMRMMLTTVRLNVDTVHNNFNDETIVSLGHVILSLMNVMRVEVTVVTSLTVLQMLKKDFDCVHHNLKVVTSAIRLKKLVLKEFCLN